MHTELSTNSWRCIATVTILACMNLLTGCGGGGDSGGPSISSSSSSALGAIVQLQWDPVVPGPGAPPIAGYYVHFGKQSPGQTGSCAYGDTQFVSTPTATLTNLDHNTSYYFAVSAYNGQESSCSEEVSTLTPPPSA